MVTLLRALWPVPSCPRRLPDNGRGSGRRVVPLKRVHPPDNPPLDAPSGLQRWRWREYLELTKPKVSLLIVFTAIVGMVLASPGMVPLPALIFGTLGIALASGSAAAFNHVLDRRIDEQMARTRRRPLPTGQLAKRSGGGFREPARARIDAGAVAGRGRLTALLTFVSLIGYAIVYTLWLKRATPQNIVIGGAAGAAPPVLGWAAVTHTIDAACVTPVPHHLHLDAAALLGARDRAARRLREGRHPHAAGDARHRVHASADRALHHPARREHAAARDLAA